MDAVVHGVGNVKMVILIMQLQVTKTIAIKSVQLEKISIAITKF